MINKIIQHLQKSQEKVHLIILNHLKQKERFNY
jgi:hypothetical protein